MITQDELEKISESLGEIWRDLQNDVIKDILSRMEEVPEVISSSDYEIWKLNQLGANKKEVQKIIQNKLNLSNKAINKIFNDWIEKGYARNEALYKKVGVEFIPYEENEELKDYINLVKADLLDETKSMTKTLGFIENKEFYSANKFLAHTLDKATLEIALGTFNYEKAIKDATKTMLNSGYRTMDYESGWSNRIDVAIRRAITTSLHQCENKVADEVAEDLDTDTFEVSAHLTARPEHQVWQGKVYSKEELVSVCGLGEITGLCGINCYHRYYPFVEGASKRTYTDKELKDMREKANTKHIFNGKELTLYEATQKQRRLETQLRALKDEEQYLKKYGGSKEDILVLGAKYQNYFKQYELLSKLFDLPKQMNRINVRI